MAATIRVAIGVKGTYVLGADYPRCAGADLMSRQLFALDHALYGRVTDAQLLRCLFDRELSTALTFARCVVCDVVTLSKIPNSRSIPRVLFGRLDSHPIQLGSDLLVRHQARQLANQIQRAQRSLPPVFSHLALTQIHLCVLTTLPMYQDSKCVLVDVYYNHL